MLRAWLCFLFCSEPIHDINYRVMKSIEKIFMLPCAVAVIIGGCGDAGHGEENKEGNGEGHHPDEIVFTEAQAKAAGLTTEDVVPGEFASVIKVGGMILPSAGDEHTVVATADGVVSLMNVGLAEGAAVSAGQALASISSDRLQDGDAVKKAKAEYDAAESDYKRAVSLADGQVVSRKQLEQARLRYEQAHAAYAGLAAAVGRGGVEVTCGISGYVKSLQVKSGDYVTVGTPLCVVTQTRRLCLRADVPEQCMRQVKGVVSANFSTSYADSVFCLDSLGGRVLTYGKALDANTAYFPVTFEFDNRGEFIAGSYADVWLIGSKRTGIISVPVSSLCESQGIYYVYLKVKGEQDTYVKREVSLGDSDGKRVEVLKGLSKGDVVVTEGAHQVRLASMSGTIPEGHSHSH